MAMPDFEEGTSCLEFQYADLRLNRDQDSDDVVEEIHNHVIDNTPPFIEAEITAVQFWPNKRFPKKAFIFFSTQRAKDIIKQRGMNLFGTAITFDEPGAGLMRIEIQNVLHSIPNHVIATWLRDYGVVTDVKNDTHRFKNGRRINWGTGVRFGWIKHVHTKIPPYACGMKLVPYLRLGTVLRHFQDGMECLKVFILKPRRCGDVSVLRRCVGDYHHRLRTVLVD